MNKLVHSRKWLTGTAFAAIVAGGAIVALAHGGSAQAQGEARLGHVESARPVWVKSRSWSGESTHRAQRLASGQLQGRCPWR